MDTRPSFLPQPKHVPWSHLVPLVPGGLRGDSTDGREVLWLLSSVWGFLIYTPQSWQKKEELSLLLHETWRSLSSGDGLVQMTQQLCRGAHIVVCVGHKSCLNSSQIFSWQNHLVQIMFYANGLDKFGSVFMGWQKAGADSEAVLFSLTNLSQSTRAPRDAHSKGHWKAFQTKSKQYVFSTLRFKSAWTLFFSICRNQQYRNLMQTSSTHENKSKCWPFGVYGTAIRVLKWEVSGNLKNEWSYQPSWLCFISPVWSGLHVLCVLATYLVILLYTRELPLDAELWILREISFLGCTLAAGVHQLCIGLDLYGHRGKRVPACVCKYMCACRDAGGVCCMTDFTLEPWLHPAVQQVSEQSLVLQLHCSTGDGRAASLRGAVLLWSWNELCTSAGACLLSGQI